MWTRGVYCVIVVVLTAISDTLSPILVILINRNFISDVRQCLKASRITPVYKGGNHSDLGSYIPVFILPVFAKIIEKFVYTQVYK